MHLGVPFSEIAKTYGFGPTPTSECCEDLWSKNIFLILACDDIIFKKRLGLFCTLGSLFPRLLKHTVLDKPTVFLLFCPFLSVLVSVLLSAHVERFSVSGMRDLLRIFSCLGIVNLKCKYPHKYSTSLRLSFRFGSNTYKYISCLYNTSVQSLVKLMEFFCEVGSE